jgi:hypothetical protein
LFLNLRGVGYNGCGRLMMQIMTHCADTQSQGSGGDQLNDRSGLQRVCTGKPEAISRQDKFLYVRFFCLGASRSRQIGPQDVLRISLCQRLIGLDVAIFADFWGQNAIMIILVVDNESIFSSATIFRFTNSRNYINNILLFL